MAGIFLSPVGGIRIFCNNGSKNGSHNKNNGNGQTKDAVENKEETKED